MMRTSGNGSDPVGVGGGSKGVSADNSNGREGAIWRSYREAGNGGRERSLRSGMLEGGWDRVAAALVAPPIIGMGLEVDNEVDVPSSSSTAAATTVNNPTPAADQQRPCQVQSDVFGRGAASVMNFKNIITDATITLVEGLENQNRLVEEFQKTNRQLQEKVKLLEGTMKEVTQEKEEMRRKWEDEKKKVEKATCEREEMARMLEAEKKKTERLTRGIMAVMGRLEQAQGILGGTASVMMSSFKIDEHGGNAEVQREEVPTTMEEQESTSVADIISMEDVKVEVDAPETMENGNSMDQQQQPEESSTSASAAATGNGNTIAFGDVKDEEEQEGEEDRRTPSRSLIHFAKQLHLQVRTGRIRILKKYSKVRWLTPSGRRNNGQFQDGQGSRRDRSQYGLRPSPPMRRSGPGSAQKRRSIPSARSGRKHLLPNCPPVSSANGSKGDLLLCHRTDESTPEFSCMCGKTFASKMSLKRHIRYFNEEWKFQCEDCGKPFFSTNYMKEHMMKVHSKILPSGVAGCSKCGQIFSTFKEMCRHRNQMGCL